MPTEKRIRDAVLALQADCALRRVSIFGSCAEGKATERSDLDLLVEFQQPAVSLMHINRLRCALEDALGLPVDIPAFEQQLRGIVRE